VLLPAKRASGGCCGGAGGALVHELRRQPIRPAHQEGTFLRQRAKASSLAATANPIIFAYMNKNKQFCTAMSNFAWNAKSFRGALC